MGRCMASPQCSGLCQHVQIIAPSSSPHGNSELMQAGLLSYACRHRQVMGMGAVFVSMLPLCHRLSLHRAEKRRGLTEADLAWHVAPATYDSYQQAQALQVRMPYRLPDVRLNMTLTRS